MTMKVEREQLEHQLRLAIEENALNKSVHEKIEEDFMRRNVPPGEVAGILTQTSPLETLNPNLLYVLTKSFYEATGKEILNPNKYFTDIEIEKAESYKRDEEEDLLGELVFENVLQVADDQWITTLPSQLIGKLYDSGRIFYNPETQRGMVHYKAGDSIIKKIDVRKSAVNHIADMIIKGSFVANTLTFNVLQNGDDEIEYDSKNMKLVIGENSEIDVVDGFHRSYGILKALIIKPDLDLNWEVRITHWDVDKAQRFIYQEDYKTPLRKHRKEELNQERFENQVAKNLNEMSRNEMQFKIANDLKLIKTDQAYTMFNTVAETIKEVFDIKSQRDVRKTSQYLVEFFNELIGIYPDEFNNLEESRKDSVLTHSNTFIGYISLASKLKDLDNWQDKLERILEKIDFSKSNSLWSELNITKTRLSKRDKSNIIKYFADLVE